MAKPNHVQGYTALSPSDPSRQGLYFTSKAGAQEHAKNMNLLLAQWGENPSTTSLVGARPVWNKEYWGNTKPEPWIVYELVIGQQVG